MSISSTRRLILPCIRPVKSSPSKQKHSLFDQSGRSNSNNLSSGGHDDLLVPHNRKSQGKSNFGAAVCRLWDAGNKTQRAAILLRLLRVHHAHTVTDIEAEYGPATPLLFTRITAWLRLSYKLSASRSPLAESCKLENWRVPPRPEKASTSGFFFVHRENDSGLHEPAAGDFAQGSSILLLQLRATGLFLQSQRYLTQFLEIGGIQTLADLVSALPPSKAVLSSINRTYEADDAHYGYQRDRHETATDLAAREDEVISPFREEKLSTFALLIHIANSGRVHREMICQDKGIDLLVKAAVPETDHVTLEVIGSLLLALGQGNPSSFSVVYGGLMTLMRQGNDHAALCAATTLHSLHLSKHTGGLGGDGENSLLHSVETGTGERAASILATFFNLLRSASVKLRFEAMELIALAALDSSSLETIIRRGLDLMQPIELLLGVDYEPAAQCAIKRQQSCCIRILCSIIKAPLMADDALRVLTLLHRFSAHFTCARYLEDCDGTDTLGMIEVATILRFLARGAFASALDSTVSSKISKEVSHWLSCRLTPDVLYNLIGLIDDGNTVDAQKHKSQLPPITESLASTVASMLRAYTEHNK